MFFSLKGAILHTKVNIKENKFYNFCPGIISFSSFFCGLDLKPSLSCLPQNLDKLTPKPKLSGI